MKIRLVMLGKTRRGEAQALLEDYIRRIKHYSEIDVVALRDSSSAAFRKLKIDSSAIVVLLDAGGKQYTSHHARPSR